MRYYTDYKRDFLAFNERVKLKDFMREHEYNNVYFCFLNAMLNHIHEAEKPGLEWHWLKGMYKKGENYLEHIGDSDLINKEFMSWGFDEMQVKVKTGTQLTQFRFDNNDEPELQLPYSDPYCSRERPPGIVDRLLTWLHSIKL